MLDICEIPSFFFVKIYYASTFLKLTLKYMVSAIAVSPQEKMYSRYRDGIVWK